MAMLAIVDEAYWDEEARWAAEYIVLCGRKNDGGGGGRGGDVKEKRGMTRSGSN